MKRMILVVLLCASTSLYADPIALTISESAATREQAVEQALVKGLEQTFGVYIYSESRASLGKLNREDVATIRQGTVKQVEVIKDEVDPSDGQHRVIVKMVIDGDKVHDIIRKYKVKTVTDELYALAQVNEAQSKLKAQRSIMENAFPLGMQLVDKAYRFNVEGYEVENVTADYVQGHFKIRVNTNPVFWSVFLDIIKSANAGDEADHEKGWSEYLKYRENIVTDGYPIYLERGAGSPAYVTSWPLADGKNHVGCKDSFRFWSRYYIPRSLEKYLPQEVKLRLRAPGGETTLALYRNIRLHMGKGDVLYVVRNPDHGSVYSMANKFGTTPDAINAIKGCRDLPSLYLIKRDAHNYGGRGDTVYTSEDSEIITEEGIVVQVPFKVANTAALKKNGMRVEIGWIDDSELYRAGWPDRKAPVFRSIDETGAMHF